MSFHYKNSNKEKTLSPSLFKRVCFWLREISQFCCPEYMEKKSIFRMFCMKSFCSFEYPAGGVLGRWLQFCPCKVRLMRVSALTINNPYGLFRFLIHLGKYGCLGRVTEPKGMNFRENFKWLLTPLIFGNSYCNFSQKALFKYLY